MTFNNRNITEPVSLPSCNNMSGRKGVLEMSEGGINIYPGYTGILCLYHHITKHVIVQWTGLDGVDQQAKLDTEENLLSFFKATIDVSNEDGIDNSTVDDTLESNQLTVEGIDFLSPAIGGQSSGEGQSADIVPTEEDHLTDIELVDGHCGRKEVRVTLDLMQVSTSSSVVEESVSTVREITSTEPSHHYTDRGKQLQSKSLLVPLKGTHRKKPLTRNIATNNPVQCTTCGKMFASKRNLRLHSVTHTGARPYKCAICSKLFPYKSYLNTHMRFHTGTKPYPCSLCDRWFTMQADAKRHQMTHTGDKPYQCSICNKKYSRKSYLNNHMKTHSVENSSVFNTSGCQS